MRGVKTNRFKLISRCPNHLRAWRCNSEKKSMFALPFLRRTTENVTMVFITASDIVYNNMCIANNKRNKCWTLLTEELHRLFIHDILITVVELPLYICKLPCISNSSLSVLVRMFRVTIILVLFGCTYWCLFWLSAIGIEKKGSSSGKPLKHCYFHG